MNWFYLDSGASAAARNMAVDQALLEAMPRLGRPLLRFYGWNEAAASFGYFQSYDEVARATILRPLIRRPTAGGIVPHDADWTYSLVFPAGHEWHKLKAPQSYERIHQWIRSAFARLNWIVQLAADSLKTQQGHCFAGYERYDLVRNGSKIAGAAQRRTRDGLLIQGSVHVAREQESSRPGSGTGSFRADWQQAMKAVASDQGGQWLDWKPDAAFLERVEDLIAHKYSQERYNRKR